MTLETGYKQRFEVNFAKPEDHVYPALKLDLSRVLERRKESDAKSGGPSGDPDSQEETTAETGDATAE